MKTVLISNWMSHGDAQNSVDKFILKVGSHEVMQMCNYGYAASPDRHWGYLAAAMNNELEVFGATAYVHEDFTWDNVKFRVEFEHEASALQFGLMYG